MKRGDVVMMAQSQNIRSAPVLTIHSAASNTQMTGAAISAPLPSIAHQSEPSSPHVHFRFDHSPPPVMRRPYLQQRNNIIRHLLVSIVGTLGLLSYISTAVVSAASAASYGAAEFASLRPHVFPITLVILALLAALTIAGNYYILLYSNYCA
jgi:hypothetical protein